MTEDDCSHHDNSSGSDSSSDDSSSNEEETILKSTPNVITVEVDALAADASTHTEHTGSILVDSGCHCSTVLEKLDEILQALDIEMVLRSLDVGDVKQWCRVTETQLLDMVSYKLMYMYCGQGRTS